MPSVYDALNRKQREAAELGTGPLLIIAAAGTGKTITLAHGVAHLVLSGAKPERMLLLAFTRRAAVGMTRRTQLILDVAVGATSATGAAVRLPWSRTFHSI